MSTQINFTTTVGRLVAGSLYKGNDKDAEGNPLKIKNGPNAGQPRLDFYFALAIPKGVEQHWAQTEWGQKIWNAAHAAYPQASQNPKFAWKITDGDSQVPNGKGKKPCEREGWARSWVLHISSGYAPRIVKARPGTNPPAYDAFVEQDAVKLGYFVQVNINADYNGSSQQPGIYLNHSIVCFSAFGDEIFVGPDASQAGFGAAPLPPGATVTPPAGAFAASVPAAAPAPLVPGVPAPGAAFPAIPGAVAPAVMAAPVPVPGAPVMAPVPVPAPLAPVGSVPTPAAPVAIAPVPTAVMPSQQFVQVPAAPAAPVPVPAAPVAPVRQLTAAANGATYEQLIANGWTDATLIQNGLMVA